MITHTLVTALGPEDPDDGDAGRRKRGTAIAAVVSIKKTRLGYSVPSQSHSGHHVVNLDDESSPFCTCPDFEERQKPCKHIYGVQQIVRRDEGLDDTATEIKDVPIKYGRAWSDYYKAQTHEGSDFTKLLRELCDTIEQQPHTNGRPRLPISDMLFSVAFKVYSTMSTRRFMSDIRDAEAKGLLACVPSTTSVFRYMEDPALTPLLKSLIERSALPLREVEVDFAPDSSGFSTATYHRWFDHKWGREIREAKWVKAHIMTGISTNVVTTAEVTDTATADSPYLEPFVTTTAENFEVREVSADKAYLSKKNLRAVEAVGGTPFIMFKINSVGHSPHAKRDHLWERMFNYYTYRRQEFLDHYHKRSNVESTFSMIKSKFGASVRSKTPVAQINEALAKILCHNVVVLVHSIYELNIAPEFGMQAGKRPPIQQALWA